MKFSKFPIIFLILFISASNFWAQDHKLDSLIANNLKIMTFESNSFSGDGWDFIVKMTQSNRHVLLGEDHFTNEIPAFTKALFEANEFKYFYIEVDPYTTEIIENSIKQFNTKELAEFNALYKDIFSFYALKPEYDLVYDSVKSGVNLLGSDQIVMFSDRVIAKDLEKITSSEKAKVIYNHIAEASKIHLEKFLKNPQNPMYMMTDDFSKKLTELESLDLNDVEHQIIKDLKYSKDIYLTQSHKKRVRLLMNQVMKDLPLWNSNKTLFKYGANHLTRGEGFLNVYDIGNLVANITESNFEDTCHIMIMGESGTQGSPFRGFPPNKVDSENGFYLSYLKPFFDVTNTNDWYVFDLRPLRSSLFKKQLTIDNLNLERTIRGYDILVIIPEVTAATFD